MRKVFAAALAACLVICLSFAAARADDPKPALSQDRAAIDALAGKIDALTARIGALEKAAASCPCSAACTCGCQSGGCCTCGQAPAGPAGLVYLPLRHSWCAPADVAFFHSLGTQGCPGCASCGSGGCSACQGGCSSCGAGGCSSCSGCSSCGRRRR